eukprot:gene12353-14487_t
MASYPSSASKHNKTAPASTFASKSAKVFVPEPLPDLPVNTAPYNAPMILSLKLVGEATTPMNFNLDTPLKNIVETFCLAKGLDPEGVQLKMFGLALDHHKTPRQADLYDQDQVDVTIKPVSAPILTQSYGSLPPLEELNSLPPPPSSTADDTNKVVLNVRYNNIQYKFKISKTDAFEKLVSGLGKKVTLPPGKVIFKFDGQTLNQQSTPEDEDMEDDDLIDANIPKNVNVICGIPEIREEFVNLAKKKNLVDDQFFAIFGDMFIMSSVAGAVPVPVASSPSSTTPTSSSTASTPHPPQHQHQPQASNNTASVSSDGDNLNLSFCTGISNDFIKILASNEAIQLQSLNLYYTNTNDQSLASIVSAYPNLKSLSIGGCLSVSDTGIKSLLKLQSLTQLDISYIRKLTASSTRNFSFPNLVNLNASWLGPETNSKEASFNKCVKGCPRLTTLAIASSNISESMLHKILAEAKRLTSLDISYCPAAITSLESKVFKYLGNLQSLSLAGCSFKEPIIRRVIEYSTVLKDLDISHQDGILPWSLLLSIVEDKQVLQHLHTLDLSHSKFDKFDVDTLLRYPSLTIFLPSI